MIRIQLPTHLRTLAKVEDEVALQLEGQVTVTALIDALEAAYPVLRGTIRFHHTTKRRPWIRFFACNEDISHESPEMVLPQAILSGEEPFLVVGAIAGG